jgi:hypothetical protein
MRAGDKSEHDEALILVRKADLQRIMTLLSRLDREGIPPS